MHEHKRPRGAARAALLVAARAEFEEHGFEGTDSNRIARRAGYAPQTFYVHFADKAAIFADVFRDHVAREYGVIRAALPDGPQAIAEALLRHHAACRIFRRSLRTLSVTDPAVRNVRLGVRRRQIEELSAALPALSPARVAALILCIDRLADAGAEDELAELGIDDPAALLVETWRLFTETPGDDVTPLLRLTRSGE